MPLLSFPFDVFCYLQHAADAKPSKMFKMVRYIKTIFQDEQSCEKGRTPHWILSFLQQEIKIIWFMEDLKILKTQPQRRNNTWPNCCIPLENLQYGTSFGIRPSSIWSMWPANACSLRMVNREKIPALLSTVQLRIFSWQVMPRMRRRQHMSKARTCRRFRTTQAGIFPTMLVRINRGSFYNRFCCSVTQTSICFAWSCIIVPVVHFRGAVFFVGPNSRLSTTRSGRASACQCQLHFHSHLRGFIAFLGANSQGFFALRKPWA